MVRKLTSTPLPLAVETTDEISMRDETGKETLIAPGAALTINKRAPAGTLTLESAGKVYIDSENRLLGKVRVKKCPPVPASPTGGGGIQSSINSGDALPRLIDLAKGRMTDIKLRWNDLANVRCAPLRFRSVGF